jgi:hypothetical protein
VISTTLHYVNSHIGKWDKVHECDFLDECHDIVKFAVIQLMGGMPMSDEDNKVFSEIMRHFIKINTAD